MGAPMKAMKAGAKAMSQGALAHALSAGDKGWQERSLRKGCHGQSQASKDCGEGVPRLGIEESFLSSCATCQSQVCSPWRHTEYASGGVFGSSCALSLYIMRSRR